MRGLSLVLFVTLSAAVPGFADMCSSVPNLVANCGFENGVHSSTIGGFTNNTVPNSWTPSEGFDIEPPYNLLTTYDNSGSSALSIGNFDYQAVASLSQPIGDVPGDTYSGSLYVAYGGAKIGDTGAFFDVLIDGVAVLALNDTAPLAYQKYTFSFVGTGSDVLTIEGITSPSEWYVDDIIVSGPKPGIIVSSVFLAPEPDSIVFLATGIALCAVGLGKRRSKKVG
jgi:hypothetical protein